METPFPFPAFQRKQDFSPAVQIPEPFRIFPVLEMAPHITVELFKPPETFSVACQGISFKHGNGGFNMHPPQFLVPFKLLLRIALTVHEIEYPAPLRSMK